MPRRAASRRPTVGALYGCPFRKLDAITVLMARLLPAPVLAGAPLGELQRSQCPLVLRYVQQPQSDVVTVAHNVRALAELRVMYHELDDIGACVDLDFHAVYRPAEGVGVVA